MKKSKNIILDRDGTIIVDKDYMSSPDQLEFIPGSIQALQLLQKHGFLLSVITNQSGIGRGVFSEKEYQQFTSHFQKTLEHYQVHLSLIRHCPHRPDESCKCRKPSTALVVDMIQSCDQAHSYVIGDKTSDIKFGENLGLKTILVKTGKKGLDQKYQVNPDYCVENLLGAVDVILNE